MSYGLAEVGTVGRLCSNTCYRYANHQVYRHCRTLSRAPLSAEPSTIPSTSVHQVPGLRMRTVSISLGGRFKTCWEGNPRALRVSRMSSCTQGCTVGTQGRKGAGHMQIYVPCAPPAMSSTGHAVA